MNSVIRLRWRMAYLLISNISVLTDYIISKPFFTVSQYSCPWGKSLSLRTNLQVLVLGFQVLILILGLKSLSLSSKLKSLTTHCCIWQSILFTTRKSSTGWAARRAGTQQGKRRKRLQPRSTQTSRTSKHDSWTSWSHLARVVSLCSIRLGTVAGWCCKMHNFLVMLSAHVEQK